MYVISIMKYRPLVSKECNCTYAKLVDTIIDQLDQTQVQILHSPKNDYELISDYINLSQRYWNNNTKPPSILFHPPTHLRGTAKTRNAQDLKLIENIAVPKSKPSSAYFKIVWQKLFI